MVKKVIFLITNCEITDVSNILNLKISSYYTETGCSVKIGTSGS
jgi:hypothetical protein